MALVRLSYFSAKGSGLSATGAPATRNQVICIRLERLELIRSPSRDLRGIPDMALLAGGQNRARRARGRSCTAVFVAVLAAVGIASIVYLLLPRWIVEQAPVDAPRLPISIAGVVFNIAPAAIRFPVQRRAGPQDRVDLAYTWPDLGAPDSHAGVSMARLFGRHRGGAIDHAAVGAAPIDLSALCRHAVRVRAGRPSSSRRSATTRPMRARTCSTIPAAPDRFLVRCTRSHDALTLATCLYELPDGAAALTFRFPRDWLGDWPAVVSATDRLIEGWRPAGSETGRRAGAQAFEIGREYRHLEIVGALVVLVVDEQHADELLADIDLGGVVLLLGRGTTRSFGLPKRLLM